ncbi:MAG: hypothetical protein O3A63_09600 [Proteobacteria bacterium]|nr:hypothetical protein [Pseudomonadota bacterium]
MPVGFRPAKNPQTCDETRQTKPDRPAAGNNESGQTIVQLTPGTRPVNETVEW